jgi:GR25 family glycosyltransferase involved in LPS biosynthesis
MDKIDVIYCINLRRRVDRLQAFLHAFPKQWITKLRILGAVDGANHELSASEKHKLRNADWNIDKKRGVWGCGFSHEGVFREIIDKKYRNVIVLEDDAVFSGTFSDFEKIVNQILKQDLNLCFLGPDNHPENTNLTKHKFLGLPDSDMICPINFNLGTMSYYINGSAAEDICRIIESRGHYRAIDYILSDYIKQRFCSVPVFSINQNLGSDITLLV